MLKKSKRLKLHHEIMLLALRDKEGTLHCASWQHAVAGAMLTELIIQNRISVDKTNRQMVSLVSRKPTGDEILDEILEKIKSKKKKGLTEWVSEFASLPKLQHRVAKQLCELKVLRTEQEKVLWMFTREVYPEVDPKIERALKTRMARLMFGQTAKHDERTTILVALANHVGLLKSNFDADRLRRNKDRLKKIISGDMYAARASRSAVEAMTAAMVVAGVVPSALSS